MGAEHGIASGLRWSRWVLDLDGVVWRGAEVVPGAVDAVARLRGAGAEVAFVTNSSALPVAEVEQRLAGHGIEARGAVLTSGEAVSTLVAVGERVLVCGGSGLVSALAAAGAEVVVNDGTDPGAVDAVVCGYWREVDYDRIRWAATAVRRGARLLASNADSTFPSAEGILPGGGATLAAVETASGVRAQVAGKPHPPMAAAVAARFGSGDQVSARGIVVGDRADTDGALAVALGWDFGLVLSGVTTDPTTVAPPPAVVGEGLAEVVRAAAV